MIKVLDTLDQSGGVINLTGATSDYLLLPGQTAKVVYSSPVNAMPLLIQMSGDCEYDISYMGDLSVAGANVYIDFQPNGATTSGVVASTMYNTSDSSTVSVATGTNEAVFNVGAGRVASANIKFKRKSAYCAWHSMASGDNGTYKTNRVNQSYKVSGCDAWSSLGRFVVSSSGTQAGTIIIRRIA